LPPSATSVSRIIHRAWRGTPLGLGIVIMCSSLGLAVFGPVIAPYDPQIPVSAAAEPPPRLRDLAPLILKSLQGRLANPVHWFGTDDSGLDIFSRVIAAPRVDVLIALAATGLSLGAGTLLGLIAGYYSNWMTEALTRASDVIQSFPLFILAMVLVALTGRNVGNIIVTLAVLFIPVYLRLTRAQVLSERTRNYVEAARATGNRELVIALRHVLPNSLAPSLIQAPITIGAAILQTAGISFVGAGVRPPTPEWGIMIASSANSIILGEWWPSVFPGLAISLTVLGYALVGNALENRYG